MRAAAAIVTLVIVCSGACSSSYGDASTDPPTGAGAAPLVRCSVERCPRDRPVCCALDQEVPYDKRYECRAEGACADGIVIHCRGAADCAASGNVCCIIRNGSQRMLSVECVAASACIGVNDVLCDKQASTCAGGEICRPDPARYYPSLDMCGPP